MSDRYDRPLGVSRRRRNRRFEDDSGSDEEAGTFLSQIRQNPFLEKEAKYIRENAELEKKSSQLFEKIDKFTSRSRLRVPKRTESLLYDGGGGGDTESELGADDSISACGDNGSVKSFREEDEDEFGAGRKLGGRQKMSQFGRDPFLQPSFSTTKLSEKLNMLSSSASEAGGRQPSRLQRATESVIQSLQSKLINHEERLADLHLQYRQKIQENTMLESKIKALEEERERLLKTISNLQQTVEKHAKSAESSKSNLSLKVHTVTSMKKELEDMKREQKASNSHLQSIQTRLHRSLDENEKLKNLNKSVNHHLREVQADSRQKTDEQHQKLIELEKQRSSLTSTVAKQAQLIRNLKEKNAHQSRSTESLTSSKDFF